MTTTTHPNPIKRAKARLRQRRIAKVAAPAVDPLTGWIEAEDLRRFKRELRHAKRPIHMRVPS
jgi:hypothetical protein